MEEDRYDLVSAVEGLEVDFQLHVNPDGSHTVHYRHGLPMEHQMAAMINELYHQRHNHCPTCTGLILKSAGGLTPGSDQTTRLARLIRAAAHHNQHLAHGGDSLVCKPRAENDSVQRDPCAC